MSEENKNSRLDFERKHLELEFAQMHKNKEYELLLNDVFEDEDLPEWDY